MVPDYVELHALSNFSFLHGASHPEELVATAHALGYAALALTDECSLAGVVRAHVAAKETGLPLIVGAELALSAAVLPERERGANPLATRVVLLATDRTGYGNLAALITRGRRRSEKGTYRLARSDLDDGCAGCLAILLPPRRAVFSASASTQAHDEIATEQACWVAERLPGRAWLAVELLGEAGDREHLAHVMALGHRFGLPCVASGDVHMHVRARRALQDTLTAIRLKCTLQEAGYRLYPNGERHLRARERLARIYPHELLAQSLAIAERCTFSLDSLRYEYPHELTPAGETPASHLRELTARGFEKRFGAPLMAADGSHGGSTSRAGAGPADALQKVRTLVEHELRLITELNYEPYFLTVHDIVAFAQSQGILCQGRGSAANSAVCYCLGITEVDPARIEMLFERFISRERNEPPDIDVDFEHQRREEVMQYVYAKYGRQRAALAATLITYRPKSAIRDVGKALGLELAQVDRLAKSLAWWDGREALGERVREAGLDPAAAVIERLTVLVGTLIGFPRHLSQHVGGFVISRGPLDRMVPIENAAMPERTVIQWDKDDLDALGLLKVDCLALGMLSAIRRALDLIGGSLPAHARLPQPSSALRAGDEISRAAGEEREGGDATRIPSLTSRCFPKGSPDDRGQPARPFAMTDIPAEDPAVYAMIGAADTIGVFQIESRAQMAMLPRLAPRCFYDLVIEVAIVRPGPIQGGMVHPYLRRRQGLEPVSYPSDAVQEVLERTLGVPIFQEQVMQLAIVAAGFSPGEADQLRRSMAAWRRKGGLWRFEERLISGMASRGYKEAFARQIFQQILGFGEYGFPESHAASFALLVYVSAWIKCHHPAAFACALLNSQPMGFYAPSQLVQDARRHGVEVRPVDATISLWDCTLEEHCGQTSIAPSAAGGDPARRDAKIRPGPSLRLGMRMVKGLAEAAVQRIVAMRQQRPFQDVPDLAQRAALNRHDLACLARAGALESLAGHRRYAAWEVAGIQAMPPLFARSHTPESPARLPAPTEAQEIVADYNALGLSLRRHPLELLRTHLKRRRMLTAAEIRELPHGRLVRAAGIVIGRQRPDTASGVIFVTMEDESGCVNVVVWRHLIERQRRELLGARLLGVYGHVERESSVVHLIAERLIDLSELLGALNPQSRDFH